MGRKGEKRREKNYLAAHGGPARLPPPPDRSKQDLLPSKLRVPHDSTKQVVEKKENNSKARVDAAAKNGSDIKSEERNDDGYTTSSHQENDELAELDGRSKRKERKKKYWEAKKQKKSQGKKEDTLRENFPKHEEIRFGDVVQAPPKLALVQKTRKTPMSASKERQRLEAYRSRNGWTSRPGVQIPSVAMQ
ncbi:BnaC04g04270D [Brassica napus]|uniref:BnaC04g04270D protein n=1 Tax=Brassica napus TaxID=3708 RepID=A0A078G2N0_BRANA|nr:BnaC04g04270D [Brassica napus]